MKHAFTSLKAKLAASLSPSHYYSLGGRSGGRVPQEHLLWSQKWQTYIENSMHFFWAKTNMDNRKVYYMNLRSSLVIQEDQDLVLQMDAYNFRWTSIINSYIIYRRVIDDFFFFWKYLKTDLNPRFIWKGDFMNI